MSPTITLGSEKATAILLFSFRYAIGRETYAPGLVVDSYKELFPQLSPDQQRFLNERLREELDSAFRLEEEDPDHLGWDCDKRMWHEFYNEYLKEEE